MIQEFADKITNFNAELDVLTTMQPTAKRSDVHNFCRQVPTFLKKCVSNFLNLLNCFIKLI